MRLRLPGGLNELLEVNLGQNRGGTERYLGRYVAQGLGCGQSTDFCLIKEPHRIQFEEGLYYSIANSGLDECEYE